LSHDYQDVIDTVDQRLLEWIGKLASRTKVLLASPGDMPGKQGVSLYLLEVIGNPPLRGVQRPPLSLLLRYLITAWLEDAAKSDRLLGELMFAAMEEKEFEVEPAPLPLAAWQAFGVAPRPAVLLRVPLNRPRPEKRVPRVLGKATVRFGAMHSLQGQVVGPGRVPIMAATVTMPSLRMTARTDRNGRFRFAAVPAEFPVTEVQVNARGRKVSLPVPAGAGDGLLLIELNENQI
jgi:hypothetical protein